jgi:hypothetical protein
MITKYDCGKLTFVTSIEEAETIKKTLINLGADENAISIKFVNGPNQYLIEIGSIDCEFPELLKDFCRNNNWTRIKSIKTIGG